MQHSWTDEDVGRLADQLASRLENKCPIFNQRQIGALRGTGTAIYWAGKAFIVAVATSAGLGVLYVAKVGVVAIVQALVG